MDRELAAEDAMALGVGIADRVAMLVEDSSIHASHRSDDLFDQRVFVGLRGFDRIVVPKERGGGRHRGASLGERLRKGKVERTRSTALSPARLGSVQRITSSCSCVSR